MSLHIIKQDITLMDVDCIVNAANNQLKQGGGVCGAIFDKAGKSELAKACSNYGYCDTGEAVITPGFNLKAKYIIHTVGPIYVDGTQNESKFLKLCYRNSLELAKKNNIRSIAFPLISSGIYRYPKLEAFETAYREISDFLLENEMNVFIALLNGDFLKNLNFNNGIKHEIELIEKEEAYSTTLLNTKKVFLTNGVVNKRPLFKAPNKSLEERIKHLDDSFSQYLLFLIDKKGVTDTEIYKKANIDRRLFSKIRSNKNYHPTKTTALALCIALELSLDETLDLLKKAGYTISHSSKTDIIVEYFINNKIYDIMKVNEALFYFGEHTI